jgi:ABC-type multidrug transport system permease subunit
MITIHVEDVVAASLAAAGACLICSIPMTFLRHFPSWALRTYGRRALLVPMLVVPVFGWLAALALSGQIDSPAGHAMVVATAFLCLLLAGALLRYYLSDYRNSR